MLTLNITYNSPLNILLTLMLLVANFINTKMMQKTWEITETMAAINFLAAYASSVSFGHAEHCFLTVWTPKSLSNLLKMTFLRR